MALTDTQLKNLKPQERTFRLSDGEGLYIEVTPKGSKLWKMAYRFDGRQKTLSFGKYPATSLARAREKRMDAKTLLQDGIDPMAHAKAADDERRALAEQTFSNIADELLDKRRKEGLAPTTLDKKAWLLDMAKADLGNLPISVITAAQVLAVLRKPESAGKLETAKRLRTVIGEVFRYAVATTRADNDPTFALKGALISPNVKHRAAATTWETLAPIVRAIWRYDGGSPEIRAALKLLVLLAPRPGELRMAEWSEFDLEKAVWNIPAGHTKKRHDHTKPLPAPALEILKELKALGTGQGLAFHAIHTNVRPISENTLNSSLRRMGFGKEEVTSHGFRATATSLLNECGLWKPYAIERELSRKDANVVRRAYNRTEYWDERVTMMEWWAKRILQMASE